MTALVLAALAWPAGAAALAVLIGRGIALADTHARTARTYAPDACISR